jgi:hypothetical protein
MSTPEMASEYGPEEAMHFCGFTLGDGKREMFVDTPGARSMSCRRALRFIIYICWKRLL